MESSYFSAILLFLLQVKANVPIEDNFGETHKEIVGM